MKQLKLREMRPSTYYTIRNILLAWAGLFACSAYSMLPGIDHRWWFDWPEAVKATAWGSLIGSTYAAISLTQSAKKDLDKGWKSKKQRSLEALKGDDETTKHDFSQYR